MPEWHVRLERIPDGATRHFYRIWSKHDQTIRDEEILRRVYAFAGSGGEGPIIARYGMKESAARVVKEVENLAGAASVEELGDAED